MADYGHADLADFIERLLRNQTGEWEIDDFECASFPKKSGLECWRECILQIVQASDPPDSRWCGVSAEKYLVNMAEALKFVAAAIDAQSS